MTKEYVGTKIVWAWPQQKDGIDGYAVKYADGYTSWSPKGTFEAAYRETGKDGTPGRMDFGGALLMLKRGFAVARAGWNGKGMWITLIQSGQWNANFGRDLPPDYYLRDFLAMKSADGGMVPWLASLTDMLAEDWTVV